MVPSDPVVRDVFVYAFRSKGWEGSDAAVDACQATYQATHPDAVITRLDIPTYRAFGGDWSAQLELAVRDGLAEAANLGQP